MKDLVVLVPDKNTQFALTARYIDLKLWGPESLMWSLSFIRDEMVAFDVPACNCWLCNAAILRTR